MGAFRRLLAAIGLVELWIALPISSLMPPMVSLALASPRRETLMPSRSPTSASCAARSVSLRREACGIRDSTALVGFNAP